MRSYFLAAAILAALCSVATGQTVVVNKTVAPDATNFNTIGAALSAVEADAAEPNIIQVTDSGVYEEAVSIHVPVEIIGDPVARPIIELMHNPESTTQFYSGDVVRAGQGGLVINLPDTLSTGTVRLKNLVLLPALGMAPDNRLRSAIENINNNLYLELDNVLITGNRNHQPITTDGYSSEQLLFHPPSTEVYDPSVIPFGAHGIVLGRSWVNNSFVPYEGEGVELLFKNSILTHLKNDYQDTAIEPERYPTGIVMHAFPASRRKVHVQGESAISFTRVAISSGGDLVMHSEGERILIKSAGNEGIRLDGPSTSQRLISDLLMVEIGTAGILDRGFGVHRWDLNNSIIWYLTRTLFSVTDPDGEGEHNGTGTINIEDSTLVAGRIVGADNGKSRVILAGLGTVTNINFINSIIGGRGAVPSGGVAYNLIRLEGTHVITAPGSAILREGPYSLRPNNPFSESINTTLPAMNEVLSADPMFQSTTAVPENYAYLPNFMAVQNDLYEDANTEGGPLGGGGVYIGGLSNVSDWALY